jgi:tetratricopeptide (TPR) repeat protein
VRWLKKALGQTGRKVAEDRCTKGYIAAREGRLDAAQKLYEDAADADDTLAVAWINAGQTALERFNRDSAALSEAERSQRLDQALTFLVRAVASDDTHAPSWRALARVQERLGQVENAEASWARVERCLLAGGGELSPEDRDGLAVARTERQRLKPAAELASTLQAATTLLGAADLEIEAATAAIDDVLRARDAALDVGLAVPAHTLVVAGGLARKSANLERARTLFEASLVERPRDLEALRNLATVCQGLGDVQAALRASMQAYRLDPTDAGLVCNVGVCHLAAGALTSAREYVDLARQLAPKDPIVLRAVAAVVEAEQASVAR